jgi:tetratricopeptide (TPR) repeat protein
MGKRINALLLMTLCLFLHLGTVSVAGATTPLAGKLLQIQGEVSVRPAGAQSWEPGRLNQDLFAGDAVRTGPVSRAAILAVDESQIKLNENTLFVLKSAAPSPRLGWGAPVPVAAPEAALSLYQVPRGEIWLRNSNEKFRFEIETPALTAAVRGTELDLRVAPDGFTAVVLLSGALVLANPQGQVALDPGEEGRARPGEAPTKRVLVQPADAVQWSLAYPGIVSYRDLPLTPGPSAPRAPAGPPGAAALVSQAEAAYDQGHLDQARHLAEEALAVDRGNPRSLTVLGWIFLQRHDPAAAAGYFRQVAAPDDATVVGLALARYRQGQVWEAYELMQQARRRLQATPLLTTMSGYFALMAGQVDQAGNLLETASVQAPDAALPRALLAQIAVVQNRKPAARSAADQALALNPRSPAALVTAALVDLSFFQMDAARRHLEQALDADPGFVEAYVYLARIWLGSDYLDRAWRTIRTALNLAPQEAEVLSMAGFIRLGYRDYQGARDFFDRAVEANPNFGDPHLGLGHYHFRYRAFDQGLAEILTATLLEPRVALFQSFLGKALYQMRTFDKALETYDYAKTLDPLDPSPYLYKGIALTDLNRPGEAIQEINRSIELNDHRAVFRSRLMLDRDLAVRNYNLAYAYSNLGQGDWAYSKALTAVKKDPTNSSAQLFLANAFAATRQRLGAGTSALLLYRLLSPANQNTFATGNDYTPMFEMPYARVLASGALGVWDSRDQNIQNYSLEAYGGLPGVAGDLLGAWGRDKGFRTTNSDQKEINLGGMFKWDPTPKTSLFLFSWLYNSEDGDNLYFSDYHFQNKPFYRQSYRKRIYEGGLVHRFTPASIFMAYMNYTRIGTRIYDNLGTTSQTLPYLWGPYTFPFLPPGWSLYDRGVISYDQNLSLHTNNLVEFYNPQVQHMLMLGKHTFLAGVDYFRGKMDYRLLNVLQTYLRDFTYGNETLLFDNNGNFIFSGPFQDPYVIPLDLRETQTFSKRFQPPKWSYTIYLLDYWRLTSNLILELGVTHEAAKTPNEGWDAPTTRTAGTPV